MPHEPWPQMVRVLGLERVARALPPAVAAPLALRFVCLFRSAVAGLASALALLCAAWLPLPVALLFSGKFGVADRAAGARSSLGTNGLVVGGGGGGGGFAGVADERRF